MAWVEKAWQLQRQNKMGEKEIEKGSRKFIVSWKLVGENLVSQIPGRGEVFSTLEFAGRLCWVVQWSYASFNLRRLFLWSLKSQIDLTLTEKKLATKIWNAIISQEISSLFLFCLAPFWAIILLDLQLEYCPICYAFLFLLFRGAFDKCMGFL